MLKEIVLSGVVPWNNILVVVWAISIQFCPLQARLLPWMMHLWAVGVSGWTSFFTYPSFLRLIFPHYSYLVFVFNFYQLYIQDVLCWLNNIIRNTVLCDSCIRMNLMFSIREAHVLENYDIFVVQRNSWKRPLSNLNRSNLFQEWLSLLCSSCLCYPPSSPLFFSIYAVAFIDLSFFLY